MTYFLRQCDLEHSARTIRKPGVRKMSMWIPEKIAKLGNVVSVFKYGKWEDGWKIVAVNSIVGVDTNNVN